MHGKAVESHTQHTTNDAVEDLGTLLRQERRSRRLSQEEVALKAGIARTTLNRWEKGAHLPRLAELNSVLDALGAAPTFRAQALSLIHAPRAIQMLRAEQPQIPALAKIDETDDADPMDNSWVFTPETGDLLRTMRLRRGMTQEYIAEQMGVRRASVSRWETGDVIPSVAHLDEIMTLLGALPEERTAFTQGVLLPSRLTTDTNRTFEAVHAHYDFLLWGNMNSSLEPVMDLEFLRLERAFTDLIPYHPEAKHFLGYTYSFHAQWLVRKQRYKEAIRYADRVLEAAHQHVFPSKEWKRSILTMAQCTVHSHSEQLRPERGIEILEGWLPLVEEPEYVAWILSDIAKYQVQMGHLRPALNNIARSCRVALRCDNPSELRVRRVDQAEMLLQTAQSSDAEAALNLLPPTMMDENPGQRLRESLCWSKGLLQVGEIREATKWLERAAGDARAHNLDLAGVNELTRRFAQL